jgi:putative nucleotidyltransferase with HDIG domain
MQTQIGIDPSKKYFAIETDSLLDNTSTHFDIYAVISAAEIETRALSADLPLLYAKAPYHWTLRELTELSRIGISKLLIDENQRNKYDRYVKVNKDIPKVDPALEPRFRIMQIQDIGAHLIEGCFLSDLDPASLDRMKEVAGDVVNCLNDDKSVVKLLQGLGSHDLYTYIHSIGVSVLTAAIAMNHGITDKALLREYALGGLLHDIGKKETPLKILNKSGPLSPQEWDIMKKHPTDGKVILEGFGLSEMVAEIVGLHHEKMDGSGYPYGLTKDQIPLHVQISTCADVFNALTTSRCYHAKRTRFEGLMFMKQQMQGKISAEAYRSLVNCLVNESEESSKVA